MAMHPNEFLVLSSLIFLLDMIDGFYPFNERFSFGNSKGQQKKLLEIMNLQSGTLNTLKTLKSGKTTSYALGNVHIQLLHMVGTTHRCTIPFDRNVYTRIHKW
mmetsp:Transcript_9473/g.15513  ORF Transcript_9473/g.15513 Transcript_9473/m.15513 type:complete len:103 (-) Transcript_9473:1087-1395(-)